jgi:penicillin-binding protein 1C
MVKRWLLNKRNLKIGSATVFILFIYWLFCLPSIYFKYPTSRILESSEGELLSARIAKDGQWRFPLADSVPRKFKTCIVQFEDRAYYNHIGISFSAFGRALYQNLTAGKVVSGGSTITMQTVRLMRQNPSRTLWEKVIEVFWATRLNIAEDKDEILKYYATYAPFGGNVVGLETASWRYYSKPAYQLTWSQTATLAVLPNAPSLIFPGKNHKLLLAKRNRLLKRLLEVKKITQEQYNLALIEPLPGKPQPLPNLAPHLLNYLGKNTSGLSKHKTTIHANKQKQISNIIERHVKRLRRNQVNNAAVIVTEVKTGKVIAYNGNVLNVGFNHNEAVDIIQAPRSSGSILKPFLYCEAFDKSILTPYTLLPDIPTHYKGYTPQNYAQSFSGAVPAKTALAQSLNIPAVRLLEKVGLYQFYERLKSLGLSTLNRNATHYGLSLVLGGAETNLWDLSAAYLSMAQTLTLKNNKSITVSDKSKQTNGTYKYSKGAIYQTFESMLEVIRPGAESNWKTYHSSQKIAWKTGTSFGFRDAWAVGVTPDYVVAVWVGNASGEGRPGVIGVKAAAPLLFDVFNTLPRSSWFNPPVNDLTEKNICIKSGHLAGSHCPETIKKELAKNATQSAPCPYHQIVSLDALEKFKVNSDCYDVFKMKKKSWFVLPPLMEHYYKTSHASYKPLPPIHPECGNDENHNLMNIIYPKKISKIYVPINLQGELEAISFEATHSKKDAIIYWHLDDKFIGSTQTMHQVTAQPSAGYHKIKLVDELGNTFERKFQVID